MSDKSNSGSKNRPQVIIVTGLSGAGKTTALNALADMGIEVVDNVPLSLFSTFLKVEDSEVNVDQHPIALGIDSGIRGFHAGDVATTVEKLRHRHNNSVTLLFMDCNDESLIKRFSGTRRLHPLAVDRPIEDGISDEREMMAKLKETADFIFETSDITPHNLKSNLADLFDKNLDDHLTIICTSFGFSRGVPRNADLVLDVRFLRNPHYDKKLRPLSGKDSKVAAYISRDVNFKTFFKKLSDLVLMLLPLYLKEGKSYLTIAFGCTGGRHRSVFIAEELGRLLENSAYGIRVVHRDLTDW